ncbi:RagB/SusD family nutrient uptake outer membrane protein [Arachidicoccus ginsenosidivorans]|uniref:RagB/SusD family nutrient uptake outer membrane protein n=2 Tax=Arachidicoccus ginsenosidivorans TaxID=496057 RepID=A0A5B8VIB4_9BACT|nr:RagB/SusD family nutrient uptake outer membrane protein [Arachidicoccus ginsenosidivorans]QEC70346.1 RagB/SusD family nutrient uptake outer membrane protein [Arachidicoccus ginsenosidivorans]
MRCRNIYLISTLLLMILGSCSKMLDQQPEDGIIRNNYWKTKEQVHAAVIGVYASLMGDPSNGAKNLDITLFKWGELRGDMLAASLGASSNDIEVMNMTTQTANPIVDWSPVYKIINLCNTVIAYAPSVLENDQTFTKDMLNGYIGEMKTLRALMYFYLVRSFGEVPLKLDPTSNDDQIVQMAKSSQADVLQQIVKDLKDAEPLTLTTYGNQASDKGRITRYTVDAIEADVYLWMENYPDAVTACDKIINAKKFGLIASSTAWFTTLFRNGNSTESIFEIQFDQQKLNDFYNMFGASSKEFIASNKVMDEIYTTEISDSTNAQDIRSAGASVRAEDNVIWKYVGSNATSMIGNSDSYTHWFFYRYADVLLMKAEALAQIPGRGQQALDLVNVIRKRAGAPASTQESPDVNNSDELSRYILSERAREFAFEGKRWYDVLRYAKKNNYEHISYLQDFVAALVPANMVRLVKEKILDHNSHYFPIYTYELETNKLLIQNPFYQ